MAGNTFGNIFKITTFGESHGPALGGVIDGCPSGIDWRGRWKTTSRNGGVNYSDRLNTRLELFLIEK